MKKTGIVLLVSVLLVSLSGCRALQEKVKPPVDVVQTLARSELGKRQSVEGFEISPPLPSGPFKDLRSCGNLQVDKVEVVEIGTFNLQEKAWPIKVKVSGTCAESIKFMGREKTLPHKTHHFSGPLSFKVGKNQEREWVVKE